MRFLIAFGRFWYDFIIGDDWKIAIAVVAALAVTTALLRFGGAQDTVTAVVGGVAVVAAFAISLMIDVRGGSSK